MRPAAIGLSMHATAAYAASEPRLSHVEPVVRSIAGYEFEVGPMIAGLLACLSVRFYVSKTEKEHKWTVDAPVTLIALCFTAAVIQSQRPIPLVALFYGTGLGAFGVGIIRVALSFVRKNLGSFGDDDEPRPPAP